MSYEDRKQERRKKRKVRNIIIIAILLLVMGRTVYGIIIKNPKTSLPQEGEYSVSIVTQSLLLMNENVYDFNGNIELNPNIEEGKRISQGFDIGKSNLVQNISSLNEELEEINLAIELLSEKNQESDLFTKDKENFESTQESLIEDIQKRINEKDYSAISVLRRQIVDTDEKLSDVSMDNTLLGISLENLQARRETVVSELNKKSLNHYSQESGLISFKIDGYESIYRPQEFENYTYDRIQISNNESEGEEDKSFNKYKIINNFKWYLAIKVDNIKDMPAYELNNIMYLKVENIDRELVGKIIAINVTGNKAVFIVEFSSYLHEYYDLRFPKVEIIVKRQDSYLIPTKAIIDNNGEKGVYIKEFNGIVRFRPIEILDENGDVTLISRGDENRYINIDSDKSVRTISLYDEILLNPKNFIEGEILN